MNSRIFVYGTLAPGREPVPLRPILARMAPLGPASVAGVLYDLGPYPGIRLDALAGRVFGQLFQLPDDPAIWQALDAYEGFDPLQPDDGLFRREPCVVLLEAGGEVECQIYVYNGNPPESMRVPLGRWMPTARP